jgi:hypothetical protein
MQVISPPARPAAPLAGRAGDIVPCPLRAARTADGRNQTAMLASRPSQALAARSSNHTPPSAR